LFAFAGGRSSSTDMKFWSFGLSTFAKGSRCIRSRYRFSRLRVDRIEIESRIRARIILFETIHKSKKCSALALMLGLIRGQGGASRILDVVKRGDEK